MGDAEVLRILVADDDEAIQRYLTCILQPPGYVVETASDGREALEKLRERPFDLLFLDIMMPKMDGIEVLQALQQQPLDRRVPVVMLVALSALVADNEHMHRWLRTLGADEFIFRSRLKQTEVLSTVQRLTGPDWEAKP